MSGRKRGRPPGRPQPSEPEQNLNADLETGQESKYPFRIPGENLNADLDSGSSLPPERIAQFNVWLYRTDGPRLFEAGEPIPDGYVDSPAKVSGHGDS